MREGRRLGEHELSRGCTKDLVVHVDDERAGQNIEHLVFARMHVRRRLCATPHLAHNEVKRSIVV
jgi:hypothetical protein